MMAEMSGSQGHDLNDGKRGNEGERESRFLERDPDLSQHLRPKTGIVVPSKCVSPSFLFVPVFEVRASLCHCLIVQFLTDCELEEKKAKIIVKCEEIECKGI